jgi:peptidoglycan/xylan/chitin deacetylase (PgdA/CDA1 family)
MKRILKNLYLHCSFITRRLYGGIGYILMLHRVCPPVPGIRLVDNAGMEMTPKKLEAIIRFFKNRDYEFISPDQLVERLPNKNNKRKFVIFTFDDGYADNYLHAYPVFKKHDVPFTIYVTTSFPDREAILWWYLLEDLLLEKDRLVIKTGSGEREFHCSSLNEKEETFRDIRSIIMNVSTNDYLETVAGIFEPYGIDVYRKTSELTLSWEQIARLSRDHLVTIGAHTVNHYTLSKLSPAEVKKEILESKRRLESHLGREVHHFAYPYGGKEEAGKREFDLVKECGFKTAVTARFAGVFPAHRQHLECLPRIFIHSGADDGFLKQVVNGTLTGMANRFRRVITV